MKKVIVSGVFVVLAALITGYLAYLGPRKADPTPREKPALLSGRIVASATRAPIPGASVILETSAVPKSAYTDDQGVFSIQLDGPHEGESAKLAIQAKGYQPREKYIDISSKNPIEDIRLDTAPQRVPSEDTGTVIAGLVVDENTNEGIPRAEVSIAGQPGEALTDDSGYFTVKLTTSGSPPRLLNLRVRKPGYKTSERTLSPQRGLKVLLSPN